jgi:peroxiredoxin Q/BCP
MLEKGQKLPAFSLPDQTGRNKSLKDLSGPKGLVLYFYPKDSTSCCTLEAQEFTVLAARFKKAGFGVAGVSRDSVKSHCSFTEKHGLGIPLLSDPDASQIRAAGAWGEKKMYGKISMGIVRSTLVVDPKGKVLLAYPKVSPRGHAETVLEDLRMLASGKRE